MAKLQPGNSGGYVGVPEMICDTFLRVYRQRRFEHGLTDPLLLENREWVIVLVEAKKVFVMLCLSSSYGNPYKVGRQMVGWSKEYVPELGDLEDPGEIAKLLGLGDVISYQEFTFGENAYLYDNPQFPRSPLYAGNNYEAAVSNWATKWANGLADEHFANRNPTFDEAQRRMTECYSKLFELEYTLRQYLDTKLTSHSATNQWWDKAAIDQKIIDAVAVNETERSGAWIDELDTTSKLRYTEFTAYRSIIMANQGAFRDILGPKERPNNWFVGCLSRLETLRNRIAHVNTLSEEHKKDFFFEANRVIRAIKVQKP